jgi:AAA15 family ATPase/GTPase
MLQSIEIENFRCFRHSRFENFGQVNLIGGKNNAGKTALLEGILLGTAPTKESIYSLQTFRLENIELFNVFPELAWGNFFYRQEKSSKVKISSSLFKKEEIKVSFECIEGKVEIKSSPKPKNEVEVVKIEDTEIRQGMGFSTLLIYAKTPWGILDDSIPHSYFFFPEMPKVESQSFPLSKFIPAGFKATPTFLAREFDEAKLNGNTNHILEAFQLIDDSIEKIDTINLGEPRIYVFRKNEKPQPLNFFGDALNKIADLILRVSNNPNCILLIDEIENGIHHTNQQEFWQMLIKLAVAKDVQIFATSHSAEMIGAFQAAALANKQEDKVRFIEMYRSKRTGEIVGDSVDMETLAFDIQNNNPYRGEE